MNRPSERQIAITQRYKTRPPTPFPNREIRLLVPNDEEEFQLLHFQILMFLADVAGYASSASRLHRRTEPDLLKAREFLSKSFYERYPQYARYRMEITPKGTPDLFSEMEGAEQDRIQLLEEVEALILEESPSRRSLPEPLS
jgi:hypothetical protein